MARIVSCFTNCYGADGVRAAVSHIKDAGISHLELALRGHNFGGLVIPEEAVITEKASDAEASEFVAFMKQNGVWVSGTNVGGADIRTREGVEITRRRIEFSKKWFDVSVVVSGAGQPQNEEERATILTHLKELGDVARGLGIVIAFETHKGPTQNAEAMLRLMSDLDHDALRLNFDTGNIAYYNKGVDPADELEKVKDLVRNVHVKDNRGGFEDWFFPALGEGGAVDFTRVRNILDGIGYDGAYTIEIEGIGGEPEPGLAGRQARVAASVAHLKKCGYLD